jgi:hypothetical protein
MHVRSNNRYWRPAVMVVICFLHGVLIIVLLRAKPTYKTVLALEIFATIYFINPEPHRVPLSSLRPRVTPRFQDTERIRASPLESLPNSDEPRPMIDNSISATSSSVDWLAEAHRSAADIVGRTITDKSAATIHSPPHIAPWDPHPKGLETTGHGLKLRIIDPCFADVDLGQTVYGSEARLQLGCTLGKKPARGDLFDSIAKPRPNE